MHIRLSTLAENSASWLGLLAEWGLSILVETDDVTVLVDTGRSMGAAPFMHQQGCCQTPVDIKRVNETLIGLGGNPNLASVLLVSLGCESTGLDEVAKAISKSGKRDSALWMPL